VSYLIWRINKSQTVLTTSKTPRIMRKMLRKAAVLGLATLWIGAQAQIRYVEPVFTDAEIVVMKDQIYGINFQEYAPASIGGPQLVPLFADVYMPNPAVDSEAERPVVLYFHTGSFLPKGLASPMGDRNDSAAVEICTRFAKMGYVAISVSYRVGWAANSTNLDIRRGTNLLAVYKSVQDAKTAVRFLRKTYAENNNPLRVNPDYISLIGQGSGGYTVLAYATLDKYGEVVDPIKFQYEASGMGILGNPVQEGDPYVDTAIVGDWNGRGGMVTLTGNNTPIGLPQVDLTAPGRNFVNYPSYSDDVNIVVNLGGALGDSLWLEPGETPIVSAHCRYDFFAPYYSGMVQVPVAGQFFPVVDVAGSHTAVRISNTFGNNNALLNAWFQDPISVIARNNIYNLGNQENLLTFNIKPADPAMPFRVNANPWDWWDPTDPLSANETNPNIRAQSIAYIDTIMGFIGIRIATVLKADGLNVGGTVSTSEFSQAAPLKVFPNPATDRLNLSLEGNGEIESVTITDLHGRVVFASQNRSSQMTIDLNGWSKGLYVLQVRYDQGKSLVEKISVR
jgi:hypothetical protein